MTSTHVKQDLKSEQLYLFCVVLLLSQWERSVWAPYKTQVHTAQAPICIKIGIMKNIIEK